MTRKLLWPILAIGVALVALPLIFQMPTRAAAGERMMSDFQPIMQADQVQKTADYYNNVFVPLDTVFTPIVTQATVDKFNAYLTGFSGMQTEGKKLVPALAQALGVSQAQAAAFMAQQFPAMTATLKGLPAMQKDFQSLMGAMAANTDVFSQVPAGIAHYEPLVTTMQANVDNYKQVNSLPDFRLFTVFFIVPGLLLVLIAGYGLFWSRIRNWFALHHHARPTHA
jgi:hypothetical protein